MKKVLLLLLVLVGLSFSVSAQKIAVVDLEKVFKDYYKTPQIEELLKKQQQVFQDYLMKKNESAMELDKKFRVAFDRSQNITLSQEERKKATEEAEKITQDLQVIRTEMQTYAQAKQEDLLKLANLKRNELLQEITETIKQLAINQGYDFVLDLSAKSANAIPVVLYSKNNVDLTLEVITILNKGNIKKDKEKK
jgi:Skp family chaperone for outer membrane proteins